MLMIGCDTIRYGYEVTSRTNEGTMAWSGAWIKKRDSTNKNDIVHMMTRMMMVKCDGDER